MNKEEFIRRIEIQIERKIKNHGLHDSHTMIGTEHAFKFLILPLLDELFISIVEPLERRIEQLERRKQ